MLNETLMRGEKGPGDGLRNNVSELTTPNRALINGKMVNHMLSVFYHHFSEVNEKKILSDVL